MDAVTGSVAVAFIAAAATVAQAFINARSSGERMQREETIRRLRAKVTDLGGDPDDA